MVHHSLVLPLRVSKPCATYLHSTPPPSLPEMGWRGELEAQRSRVELRTIYWKREWDKKTNSNGSNTNDRVQERQRIIRETSLIPSHPIHYTTGTQYTQGRPSPILENNMKWYRITFVSQTRPLLPAAKINSVVAIIRTLLNVFEKRGEGRAVHLCTLENFSCNASDYKNFPHNMGFRDFNIGIGIDWLDMSEESCSVLSLEAFLKEKTEYFWKHRATIMQ